MPPPLSRRFMYPSSSTPCENFIKRKEPEEIFTELHRDKFELKPRTSYLKPNAIGTAKGSAYMEYGKTKLIALVEPPREIHRSSKKSGVLGEVVCSLKYAPFSTSDSKNLERRENLMSKALKKALDPVICRNEFPSFELEIKVLVLDDDGCVLSTAINCCGIALIDGGIPTYDLITASTISFYKDIEFVNPTAALEKLLNNNSIEDVEGEHGILVASSLATLNQISMCYQKGFFSPEKLKLLNEHAIEINKHLLETVRYTLINKVKQHVKDAE
ncbi:exosome complex component ski6 [Teleopsis dalmanni]|uniref:exosome complex component ski6 n=1 Tax=Teleopsis dalmanni TaxID=139649 RepID=UPI0018CF2793|nr:exosome complex component ski6 [Teleopsis dalmanni]